MPQGKNNNGNDNNAGESLYDQSNGYEEAKENVCAPRPDFSTFMKK